jgi:hypothetical protein
MTVKSENSGTFMSFDERLIDLDQDHVINVQKDLIHDHVHGLNHHYVNVTFDFNINEQAREA